jgi:hypothetical protein
MAMIDPTAPQRPRKPGPQIPPASGRTGRQRRLRVVFLTCVTLIAVTASLVVANLVSDRYTARMDLTAAGNQRLAPRTERLLGQMTKPFKIVIAADLNKTDARARERVKDVLAEMRRSNRNLDFSIIDTTSAVGLEQYKQLLRDLAKRDEKLVHEQSAAIDLACGAATSLSTYLNDTLSPGLLEIENGITPGTPIGQTNRAFFEQSAATARLLSKDLASAAGKAADALRAHLDDIAMPGTDRAAVALIEVVGPGVDQLTELTKQMRLFTESAATRGPASDLARVRIPEIEKRRDEAAVLLDSMRRLKRLDLLRIVDVLRSANAALVLGPEDIGLCAIDLESLLPSTEWLNATGVGKADLNRRAEELLATSLSSLLNPIKPIVVIVHGEPRPFMDQMPLFSKLGQRLQLRGIDLLEWAVVTDPAPPKLNLINPKSERPVVYVSFPPDTTAGTQGAGQGVLNGVQRGQKLAEALTSLSNSGKNLLLSINQSILPTYGQADPTNALLLKFGLAAESGRPLLSERVTPQGRQVSTDQIVLPEDSTSLLAGAIRGLPMAMPWPVALFEKPVDDKVRLTISHLYSLPANESTWAESQWLSLWQTPREQRPLLPDPPKFDDGRDTRWPEGRATGKNQSWLLAAAVERNAVGSQSQRVLIVGSKEWFIDPVTQPQVSVDGRTVATHPGNMELFEAGVSWLANQDELIAQSPNAQAVAIIQPIDEKVLSGLRTTMIVGMPLAVLLLGALFRLIRG